MVNMSVILAVTVSMREDQKTSERLISLRLRSHGAGLIFERSLFGTDHTVHTRPLKFSISFILGVHTGSSTTST